MIGMMIVSGYLFKKMSEKPFSIRIFAPPWGKRKVPAFVSKAGTYYGGELGIRTLGAFRAHSISSAAPSTTRTTLHVVILFFQIPVYYKANRGDLSSKIVLFSFFAADSPLEI